MSVSHLKPYDKPLGEFIVLVLNRIIASGTSLKSTADFVHC